MDGFSMGRHSAKVLMAMAALLFWAAQNASGGTAKAGGLGRPEVGVLDSGHVRDGARRFLFLGEGDVEKARERAKKADYKQAVESLDREADKAKGITLESIDRSWWDEVKDKPWSDTYPIIYEKTCLEPLRMVRPAYYAALRYAVNRDEKDLGAARRILIHLGDYSFEFEHYDVGMNYAVWGHLALYAYDVLFEQLSDAERAKLDAFFTRMGRAVMKNDVYWIENNIGGGINNHLAWHKMMLGTLGLFYGREELVEYGLRGPRGLLSLLELGLVDDGLWCESSLNYHFTAIVPMIYLAEAMRNTGCRDDLYTLTTANGRTMKQSFDAMFGVLFPDGGIPPIGDTYGRRRRLSEEFCYAYALRAYGQGRYAWLLQEGPRERPELLFVGAETGGARKPRIKSRLYPEHGYGFLRSVEGEDYWGSDSWCAFLNFDRSGVHCNQDKLSLMLFGCGRLLVADVEARASEAHAFSAKVQRELNRSALSQNTVMIDYHDQRPAPERLRLAEYRDLPGEKVITAVDDEGHLYEGVRQSRTICVRDEYVLDVFQVVCDAEHNIDWIIHTLGRPESQKASVDLMQAKMEIPGPGSWLRDFRAGRSDGEFRVEWLDEDVRFRMTMAGLAGTKLVTCGYPETDRPGSATVPMLLVERRAEKTIFAAVYQAQRSDLPRLHISELPDTDGRLVYQVTGPWGQRRHLIRRLP
jgi:hypothetical protein